MSPRRTTRLAALAGAALLLTLAPGCLYVGLGIAASEAVQTLTDDGSSSSTDQPPPQLEALPQIDRADLVDETGAASATRVAVPFRLAGASGEVDVAWRVDGPPGPSGPRFMPATEAQGVSPTGAPRGPGGQGSVGGGAELPGGPDQGTLHLFVWDAATDLHDAGLVEEDVVLRLTPRRGGREGGGREVRFRAGNRPPVAAFEPFDASARRDPNPVVERDVISRFTLADTAGDDVRVTLSVGAPPSDPPHPVRTLLGSRGTEVELRPTPGGATITGDFAWDTIDRFGVTNVPETVLLLRAVDRFGLAATASALVSVENDAPPAVVELSMGLIRGDPQLDGRVPIRFRLVDSEADIDPDGPSGRPDVRVQVSVRGDAFVDALGVVLRENGHALGIEGDPASPGLLRGLRARPLGAPGDENLHEFLWDARGQGYAEQRASDIVVTVTPISSGAAGVSATFARRLGTRDTYLQTFLTPSSLTGSNLRAFDVADVSGDGIPDIVAVEAGPPSRLVISPGSGTGTFLPAVRIAIDANPVDLAIGDLDGDGRPDVVVAHGGSGISALRNTGAAPPGAPFVSAGPQQPVAGDIVSVALGDVDRDGRLDAAVVRRDAGAVTIALGTGAGTFVTATALSIDVGGTPSRAALADLDGDGRLDLVSDGPADGLAIRAGNGDGTFGAEGRAEAPARPTTFAIDDVDGDRALDLLVGASPGGLVTLLGRGDGSFGAPITSFVPSPGALRTGDFDGDGAPDLVVYRNIVPAQLDVVHGGGDGTFGAGRTVLGEVAITGAVRDVNGDGRPDSLDLRSSASPDVRAAPAVVPSRAVGQASFVYVDASTPVGVQAADFDGDGSVGVAVALAGRREMRVAVSTSDGSLVQSALVTFTATPTALVRGDVTGDGRNDLCVPLAGENALRVLRGNGDGTFAALAPVPLAGGPSFAALGRLDAGPAVDAAVVEAGAGGASAVEALLGDGAGGFTSAGSFPAPQALSLALEDVDGDGALDAVLATAAGDVAILRGTGAGGFEAPVTVAFGVKGPPLVLDLDGDGYLDIVVARATAGPAPLGGQNPPAGQAVFLVRRGLGGGRFGPAIGFSSRKLVDLGAGACAADLTGSGRMAFAHWGGALVVTEVLPDMAPGRRGRGDGAGAPLSLARDAVTGGIPALGSLIAAGDFDGDGQADALCASNFSCEVSVVNTSRGSLPVAGEPGVRIIPGPPLDVLGLAPSLAPAAGRRLARASLSWVRTPEGATVAARPISLPLHASLTQEELEGAVVRVFAERRTLSSEAPPVIDAHGAPVQARIFEVARRDPEDPTGALLPQGVTAAAVDAEAGTVVFDAADNLRLEAFLELPASSAVLYRETFDARAEDQPGLAPRPAGWIGGPRFLVGRPITASASPDRPAPASAPNLIAIGLAQDIPASIAESITSAAFRLGPAPAGTDVALRLREWHDLGTGGDAATVALVVSRTAGGAPVRVDLATFTASDGAPALHAKSFTVTSEVAAALAAAGATEAAGAECRLELRLASTALGARGRGFFVDDIELVLVEGAP